MQDAIAAVHDIAFGGDENILTLHQEDLFGLAGPVGKAKKLERNGRRRRWSRCHPSDLLLLIGGSRFLWFRDNHRHRPRDKNISSVAGVFDFFGLAEKLQVESGI